jgi:SAM-dependent methyltransferase
VPHHAASDTYQLDRYRLDRGHLSDVVRFDLPRLGPIEGLDVAHLQCHIGTDTISLARLGARVTGLDFSGAAIAVARELAATAGPHVDFVEADVYDAVAALGGPRFDRVFTGIGALCWLPDVRRWAATVAGLLRPGGELFIREGHPVLWAMDDPRDDGLLVMAFPYFETEGVPFSEATTYVDHDEPLGAPDIVHFNHGLAEIFNAVWDAGMEITMFVEHDTVPWNPLGDAMVHVGGGEYRLADRPARVPMTYTLRARRP